MRAKFINEASKYWDGDSKYKAEYEHYWDELVPPSGEADTMQGEILRMMSRIMYEWYNNGFINSRREEAEFLDEHSDKFKPYMKDPKIWDAFFSEFEEIHFGDNDAQWREAEEEAAEEDQMYSRGSYYDEDDEEYEEESSPDDFFQGSSERMQMSGWDKVIDDQMDAIMDGIIQYIRMTENNLQPLQK